MTIQCLQSCRWFELFLRLRPTATLRAFQPRREHVVTWTDVAGNRKVCVFLFRRQDGWHWAEWRVPKSLMRLLIPRNDEQINFLELAAVALALSTFQQFLRGQAWTAWIDNQGVVGSLIRGSSRTADANSVIAQMWLLVAKYNIALEVGRVASSANIADGPTRVVLDWVRRTEAVFHSPVIFAWLQDPWSVGAVPVSL